MLLLPLVVVVVAPGGTEDGGGELEGGEISQEIYGALEKEEEEERMGERVTAGRQSFDGSIETQEKSIGAMGDAGKRRAVLGMVEVAEKTQRKEEVERTRYG